MDFYIKCSWFVLCIRLYAYACMCACVCWKRCKRCKRCWCHKWNIGIKESCAKEKAFKSSLDVQFWRIVCSSSFPFSCFSLSLFLSRFASLRFNISLTLIFAKATFHDIVRWDERARESWREQETAHILKCVCVYVCSYSYHARTWIFRWL